MRLVHAHFPIMCLISKDKRQIEVKNFLGGKRGHVIQFPDGCSVFATKDMKDELTFDGIDNAKLSLFCARVSQVCRIGNKDERKFLDGIFVSQKTLTNPKEE
jgi:large subunit ribosomal protein L9e